MTSGVSAVEIVLFPRGGEESAARHGLRQAAIGVGVGEHKGGPRTEETEE